MSSLLELEDQERALGVFFDTLVVCSVTGSSQAGLVVGTALERSEGKRARKIIGIDASGKPEKTWKQVSYNCFLSHVMVSDELTRRRFGL
jgi:1-aminocyclopropane-1-carboxylate deaminase